jgi:hypothetical protein
MMACDLIALASAHGIDLSSVGGSASDTQGVARTRRRTKREVELGIEVAQTVRGAGSRTYRRPTWSIAELGQAAGGPKNARVDRIPWLAALYSFAGDTSGYWDLWHALALESHKLSRNDYWEPRLKNAKGEPEYYQGKLAALVLDADMHRPLFLAGPGLFAVYMNVTPETWDRKLASRYTDLQGVYERWLAIARSTIQKRLNEHAVETTQ